MLTGIEDFPYIERMQDSRFCLPWAKRAIQGEGKRSICFGVPILGET